MKAVSVGSVVVCHGLAFFGTFHFSCLDVVRLPLPSIVVVSRALIVSRIQVLMVW